MQTLLDLIKPSDMETLLDKSQQGYENQIKETEEEIHSKLHIIVLAIYTSLSLSFFLSLSPQLFRWNLTYYKKPSLVVVIYVKPSLMKSVSSQYQTTPIWLKLFVLVELCLNHFMS